MKEFSTTICILLASSAFADSDCTYRISDESQFLGQMEAVSSGVTRGGPISGYSITKGPQDERVLERHLHARGFEKSADPHFVIKMTGKRVHIPGRFFTRDYDYLYGNLLISNRSGDIVYSSRTTLEMEIESPRRNIRKLINALPSCDDFIKNLSP